MIFIFFVLKKVVARDIFLLASVVFFHTGGYA